MIGRFALVLHSHLPWLRGHGQWPVGEEWLHQAIAHSYERGMRDHSVDWHMMQPVWLADLDPSRRATT